MINLEETARHLNENRLSTEEFDRLLSEYFSSVTPRLENPLLGYVLLYASRLHQRNMLSQSFAWVRKLLPPPARYLRNNNDWNLVYDLSEDCIYFIHIINDRFEGFATNCACTDMQAINDQYQPWDNPIEWGEFPAKRQEVCGADQHV